MNGLHKESNRKIIKDEKMKRVSATQKFIKFTKTFAGGIDFNDKI